MAAEPSLAKWKREIWKVAFKALLVVAPDEKTRRGLLCRVELVMGDRGWGIGWRRFYG